MSTNMLFIPLNDMPNEDELLQGDEKVRESRVEPARADDRDKQRDGEHTKITPTGKQLDFVWGFLFFDYPEIYTNGNTVFFHGEVTKESINQLKRELIRCGEKLREGGQKMGIYDPAQLPITLSIHSPGGCVKSGFDLIDFMDRFPHPIHTLGTGTVASMAALILMAGKKRYLSKYAHVLIHQIRTILAGKRADVLDYLKHLEDLQTQFIQFITERTKLGPKQVEELLSRESWIPAEDAKKMGIVDEIV